MSDSPNAFEADVVTEYEDTHASELSNQELRKIFYKWADRETKPSTASFYETNFDPFFEEAKDADAHLTKDATKGTVKTFLQNEADSLQPKTVGHRYSAISRFYSVLKSEYGLLDSEDPTPTEQLNRNDVAGMSDKTMRETEDGKDFHYLTADQVTKLIENAPDPEPRNRALLCSVE